MKILLAAVLLGVAMQASAMRCGGSLIVEGLNTAQVIRVCGEPTEATQDQRTKSYDALYYKQDNGMYYTLRIVNDIVVSIDENRSI